MKLWLCNAEGRGGGGLRAGGGPTARGGQARGGGGGGRRGAWGGPTASGGHASEVQHDAGQILPIGDSLLWPGQSERHSSVG